MIKIISERKLVTMVENRIDFDRKDDPSSGFSFHADENWNIVFNPEYEKSQRESYEIAQGPEYNGPIHRTNKWTYMEPAHAICKCGKEISLQDEYLGACECPHCNRWYNLFGQELNNPTEWEEDYDF